MRRFIPNLLTLLNLLCGAVAVTITLFAGANLETCVLNVAVFLVVLGALFDVFDGFTARKLGVASPLGVQLDSLADLVTFGFAPSILYFHLQVSHAASVSPATLHSFLVFSPLMLLLFSAYRPTHRCTFAGYYGCFRHPHVLTQVQGVHSCQCTSASSLCFGAWAKSYLLKVGGTFVGNDSLRTSFIDFPQANKGSTLQGRARIGERIISCGL